MINKAFLFAILLCLATAHCGKKSGDTSSSNKADGKPASPVICFTTGDGVNVRSAASVDAASIEKLPLGSMITVTGESFSAPEVTVNGMKGQWLFLSRKDGKTGYIFSKFVRKLDQMFSEPFVSNDTISGSYDWGWGDTGATDSEYSITISFGSDGRVEETSYFEKSVTSKGRYQKLGDYLFVTLTTDKADGGSGKPSRDVLHFVKCPLDDHEEMLLERMKILPESMKEENSDEGKMKMYYAPSKR
ncbi:MAG TPA: SH3 domain-containing protein [Spirochaetota bacterium]|nr:SH3 domain-containing protein [Spirochaetota bacterium]